MGASHHYAISDPATFDQLAGRFDLILNTVSAQVSVDSYLKLLHWTGTLVALGLPPEPLPVLAANLVHRGRSFAGSMIGGIAQTQEMLDFCAERGPGSDIEVIRADEINWAYERVLKSDVRYRFVIDTTTI